MKIRAVAAAFTALIVASPVSAGHEDHAAEAAPAVAEGGAVPCRDEAASAVDKLLGSLPVQIEAIRETEDPEERQRLLRDHLLTMEEVLHLMGRPSMSRPDDAPAAGKRAEGAPGKGMKHGMQGKERAGRDIRMHRNVEERLDRLQQLIRQLIENELAQDGDDEG